MRDPRIADLLRREAQRRATTTETGSASFDRLTLAYYPACRRYTWFLDGDPVTKREAIRWLIGPAKEETPQRAS